jgi:hypothetical protein
MKRGRIQCLDGLRALSAGAVVLMHSRQTAGAEPMVWFPPALAVLGVRTFFALSGYVITGVLLREWESRGAVDLREFFARRGRRLAPALAVFLAFVAAADAFTAADESAFDWLSSLTFTKNFYTHTGSPLTCGRSPPRRSSISCGPRRSRSSARDCRSRSQGSRWRRWSARYVSRRVTHISRTPRCRRTRTFSWPAP